jgi:hypothetical protein
MGRLGKLCLCGGVLVCLATRGLSGAPPPEGKWVTAVDLHTLLKSVLPQDAILRDPYVERRGVSADVVQNGKRIGSATLGVFGDTRAAAAAAFEEHLRFTSISPPPEPVASLGQQTVRWGKKRVLWQRDNAVVDMSLPESLIEPAAVALDKALAAGTCGVRRGATAPVPQITEVKVPPTMTGGTAVPAEIVVELPREANGEYLGVADSYGISVVRHVAPGAPQRVRAVYTVCFTPNRVKERTEVTHWVCYATRGCVVAPAKAVTLVVLPE